MLTIATVLFALGMFALVVYGIGAIVASLNYKRYNSSNAPMSSEFHGVKVKTQNGWKYQ